jgi:hypothetical protein
VVAVPCENQTERDANEGLAAGDDEWLAERIDDLVGEHLSVAQPALCDVDDRELVATKPSELVAGLHELLQPLADSADQLVTGLMTERVVDLLEAVKIEHHQRDLLIHRPVLAKGGSKGGIELCPIGEARERIVRCLMRGALTSRLERARRAVEPVDEDQDEDERDDEGAGDDGHRLADELLARLLGRPVEEGDDASSGVNDRV